MYVGCDIVETTGPPAAKKRKIYPSNGNFVN